MRLNNVSHENDHDLLTVDCTTVLTCNSLILAYCNLMISPFHLHSNDGGRKQTTSAPRSQ